MRRLVGCSTGGCSTIQIEEVLKSKWIVEIRIVEHPNVSHLCLYKTVHLSYVLFSCLTLQSKPVDLLGTVCLEETYEVSGYTLVFCNSFSPKLFVENIDGVFQREDKNLVSIIWIFWLQSLHYYLSNFNLLLYFQPTCQRLKNFTTVVVLAQARLLGVQIRQDYFCRWQWTYFFSSVANPFN
jgi:hypothetical protein